MHKRRAIILTLFVHYMLEKEIFFIHALSGDSFDHWACIPISYHCMLIYIMNGTLVYRIIFNTYLSQIAWVYNFYKASSYQNDTQYPAVKNLLEWFPRKSQYFKTYFCLFNETIQLFTRCFFSYVGTNLPSAVYTMHDIKKI